MDTIQVPNRRAIARWATLWVSLFFAGLALSCNGCEDPEGPAAPSVEPTVAESDDVELPPSDLNRLEDDRGEDSASELGSEMVVLIHGLGRTQFSMLALQWSLEHKGYEVLNWGYSSTCCSVDELGAELAEELRQLSEPRPSQIHFVGHSLGNIIARWVLSNDAPEEAGRVVMLAPPNQGSATADRYAEWFGWLLDPLDDLVTDADSTVRDLSDLEDREVGVIAGKYDGKVSVEEAELDSHDSPQVVTAAHTFIMNRPDVHSKILTFLEHGEF